MVNPTQYSTPVILCSFVTTGTRQGAVSNHSAFIMQEGLSGSCLLWLLTSTGIKISAEIICLLLISSTVLIDTVHTLL